MSERFFLEELKKVSPMPWRLEQDNSGGVCVMDSRGNVVFEAWFNPPSEIPNFIVEDYIKARRALAHYLVTMSEKEAA